MVMKLHSCRLTAEDSVIEIRDTTFDPETEMARFRGAAVDCGAIASFVGIVRAEQGVTRLTLEHYSGVTEAVITRHVESAKARFDIDEVMIIHRVGDMAPREPIVLVAVSSMHRRAALMAVDFLMDYLKSEAPFWKKELRGTQEVWIEPREQDKADLARWSE